MAPVFYRTEQEYFVPGMLAIQMAKLMPLEASWKFLTCLLQFQQGSHLLRPLTSHFRGKLGRRAPKTTSWQHAGNSAVSLSYFQVL